MGVSSTTSQGKVLDLSHHLSTEARERTANPMKAIWKVAQSRPNAISLANGDPHFSLYPVRLASLR
jgi:aromatic amino acid aminotransferase I